MGTGNVSGSVSSPLVIAALLLVLATAVLLCMDTVSADNIFVPDDHPTIQQAVDNASVGDWIIIKAGTYYGPVIVTRPMTLTGWGLTTITHDGEFILNLIGPDIRVNNLTIKGTGSSHGILCQQLTDGHLSDLKVVDCADGLRLDRAYDNLFRRSSFEDCDTGIRMLNGSYGNRFQIVKCEGNGVALVAGSVSYQVSDSNNTFTSCSFLSNTKGVVMGSNAPYTTFKGCYVRDNIIGGLSIDAVDCLVQNCSISGNGGDGIRFTKRGVVSDSRAFSNGGGGIVFDGANGFSVHDITTSGNWAGIYVISSRNSAIARVTVEACEYGLFVSQSSYGITVSDSVFNNCSITGALVNLQCDRVSFDKCRFSDNFRGVDVSQSTRTLLEDCTFVSNRMQAIRSNDAPSVSLIGCDVQWTTHGSGMTLEMSPVTLVENCTVLHNSQSGIAFIASGMDQLLKVVISGCTISHNGDDGISLDYVKDSSIINNRIGVNDGAGIDAFYLVDSTIINNSLIGNGQGINLDTSNGNIVSHNRIDRSHKEGIRLRSSGSGGGNTVSNNSIVENSWRSAVDHAGIALVDLYTRDNIVEDNDLLTNPIGVLLESYGGGCKGNIVRHNTLRECEVGAVVTRSRAGPNTFYLNNFMSNDVQVDGVHGDDDFHSGLLGNYWDDYKDRYPFSHRVGAVWNVPYQPVAEIEVYDWYPLAFKYETDPPWVHIDLEENVTVGYFTTIDASGSWDATMILEYTWVIHPLDRTPRAYSTTTPYLAYRPGLLGVHRVTVSAMDVWGNWGSISTSFNVIDDEPPEVVVGGDMVVDVGEQFQLTTTYLHENHEILVLFWTIDPDGLDIFAAGSTVYIAIATVGIFEATIYVEDRSGNSASDSLLIHVVDRATPVARAGKDVDASMGDTVALDGRGSSDNVGVANWTWTFEYELVTHTLKGERVTFTFERPGEYTIRLSVVDEAGNKDDDSILVRVHDTVPPVADAGEDQQVAMGTRVYLDASGSSDNIGITRYQWSVYWAGSMGTLTRAKVSYTFQEAGERTITLYVYDAEGNWDSDEVVITVVDTEAPVADINLPRTLVLGTTISLDGTASRDNLEVTDHRWTVSYGDRTKHLTGELPEFTFSSPGYYDIKLTVFDDAGNTGEATHRLHVPAPESEERETASWVVPAVVVVLVSVLLVGLWLSLVRWRTE